MTKDVQFTTITLNQLDANTGQIPGLPANPRDWTDKELRNLARSMQETPLLAQARGAVVVPYEGRYVVLGGNMRRAAALKLGWDELACAVIPEDTPTEELKAIVLKDNSSFGKFNLDMLKTDWGEFEFQDLGITLPEAPKGTKEPEFDLGGNVDCYTSCDFIPSVRPGVYDMELAFICALGFQSVKAFKVVSDNIDYEQYKRYINNQRHEKWTETH